MPSEKHRESRRPYQCARNRKLATSVPWDARGDFVVTALKDWAEHKDSNVSALIMEALEWYFVNRTPEWFYKQTVDKIESAEFMRLHRPETGGFCHQMSCNVCYSRRSAHAEANRAIRAEQRRD